ncbi:hypothetical protein A5892_16850 [Halotalea alkalilenta]|uniref:Heptosyltransferase n=2 Tax=Halotalea alkalilenta TaxID=376489 RepID=A0A172YIB0_9GAMM|nr:hypothetical protein A5892_16850 [Halotalea alkalilenta]
MLVAARGAVNRGDGALWHLRGYAILRPLTGWTMAKHRMSRRRIERELGRRFISWRHDYTPAPMPMDAVKSAVVYVPKALGDSMATFPAIRALQQRGVEKIIVVASRHAEAVFSPLRDEGVEVRSIPHDRAYREVKQMARSINADHGRIDLCVEATLRDASSAVYFVGTLKARMNLQFSGSKMKCYLPKVSDRALAMYASEESVPRCWAALMSDAGVGEMAGRFELPIPLEIERQVSQALEPLGRYIALNLDGGDDERKLTLEKGGEICQILIERYSLPVVLIASPAGEAKAAALAARFPTATLPELPRSIHHSGAIVKGAELLVSPDTSVVHVASAYDRPVVAFYSKQLGLWLPQSTRQSVVVKPGDVNALSAAELIAALDDIDASAEEQSRT